MASIKKLQLRAAAWGIGAQGGTADPLACSWSPLMELVGESCGLSVALLCDLGQTVTLSGNVRKEGRSRGNREGAGLTGAGGGMHKKTLIRVERWRQQGRRGVWTAASP